MHEELVGETPVLRELRRSIARLAALPTTVLIQGETGSGKGVVARALHNGSPRSGRPFVHVDCASLAPSVIESELFGHERGAFTGAIAARAGRIERAEGGTLFLDEIGELSPPLQAKLLRALQERVIERVGGDRPIAVAARIIAATNVELEPAVASGAFRADLFYRLRVASLRVPPLRDRLADLPLLVDAALERLSRALGVARPRASADFVARLAQHAWPGNVRELCNLLESLLALGCGDTLSAAALDAAFGPDASALPLAPGAESVSLRGEPERIAHALAGAGGNVARAARRLGLARSTLRARIRRYDLARLIPRD